MRNSGVDCSGECRWLLKCQAWSGPACGLVFKRLPVTTGFAAILTLVLQVVDVCETCEAPALCRPFPSTVRSTPHVCHWADHVNSLLISPSRAVLPHGRPQGSVGRTLRSAQKCSVPLLMLILVFGAKLDRAQARKPTPHTHPVLCSAVQEQVSLGWVVDSRLLGHA